MVSRETFQEWIVPYAKELIERIHSRGRYVIQHYHGQIRLILEDFLTMALSPETPLVHYLDLPRRDESLAVPRPLDEEAVRRAAALYLGRHDFASLASSGGSASTVRTSSRMLREKAWPMRSDGTCCDNSA